MDFQTEDTPKPTQASVEFDRAERQKNEPKIRDFDLKKHLRGTLSAERPLRHVRVGLENVITTKFMQAAVRQRYSVPKEYEPRWGQYKQIEKEQHTNITKRRQVVVFSKMPFMGGLAQGPRIDWHKELKNYKFLNYHKHYLQPFHSLPGGWLSPMAAQGNESAMRALFAPATRNGCEGLREVVASMIPRDAKVVYDFGAANGAQSAAFAERLGADAKVFAIDPSPFGLILGRKLHTDPRIQWTHGFAEEQTGLENTGDVVNMFFLLHETPDFIKRKLLAKAYEVLKPGGQILVAEPPLWDLEYRSRGFFEPFREQWPHFDGRRMLEAAGFTHITQDDVADPAYVHCWQAKKPFVS